MSHSILSQQSLTTTIMTTTLPIIWYTMRRTTLPTEPSSSISGRTHIDFRDVHMWEKRCILELMTLGGSHHTHDGRSKTVAKSRGLCRRPHHPAVESTGAEREEVDPEWKTAAGRAEILPLTPTPWWPRVKESPTHRVVPSLEDTHWLGGEWWRLIG